MVKFFNHPACIYTAALLMFFNLNVWNSSFKYFIIVPNQRRNCSNQLPVYDRPVWEGSLYQARYVHVVCHDAWHGESQCMPRCMYVHVMRIARCMCVSHCVCPLHCPDIICIYVCHGLACQCRHCRGVCHCTMCHGVFVTESRGSPLSFCTNSLDIPQHPSQVLDLL